MKSVFASLIVVLSILTLSRVFPVYAQVASEESALCGDEATFSNGVRIVIDQLLTGYTYRATVIGLSNFNPVLAIQNQNSALIACSDDSPNASNYAANLPSQIVAASGQSAQVTFIQNGSRDSDTSLLIGGLEGILGEFILVLEGMALTDDDGIRDIYRVNLSPEMVSAGASITLYMLAEDNSLIDPYIYQIDSAGDVITDSAGNEISCDNAGDNTSCWGNSANLTNLTVSTRTGTLTGSADDAMLSVRGGSSTSFALTTSPSGSIGGQYVPVFHISSVQTTGGMTSANIPNWCEPGQAWGDGRCESDDPWVEDYMWKAGWCRAMDEADLLDSSVDECIVALTGAVIKKPESSDDEEPATGGGDGDGDE